MIEEVFYRNNRTTALLEHSIPRCESFEDFERRWSEELLNEDTRIGDYLGRLMNKYDRAAAAVSKDALKYAGHAPLYVRRKRDVIIWFGLMKHQDLHTVNDLLVERGLQPLIREK